MIINYFIIVAYLKREVNNKFRIPPSSQNKKPVCKIHMTETCIIAYRNEKFGLSEFIGRNAEDLPVLVVKRYVYGKI